MIETHATVLGYPRMGPNRELKRVTEGYWAGDIPAAELRRTAQALRRDTWQLLSAAGLDELPVNDFSLYDHVLDTTALLGAAPPRHAAVVPEGTPDPRHRPGGAAGDDEVVRHQLPLPRAGAGPGHPLRA